MTEPDVRGRYKPSGWSGLTRYRDAAVALGLVIVAFGARLPALRQPLDRDMATYAAIGRNLGSAVLYRDLFDHKQPLTYSIYWIVGILQPYSTVAIRTLAGIVAAIAAYLLWIGLRDAIGDGAAILAGSLFGIVSASPVVQGSDLNSEHLAAPLLVFSVLLPFMKLRLDPVALGFWSGIGIGLAAVTKASLAPIGLAALVAVVLTSVGVRRRAAVGFFVGGGLVLALTVGIFLSLGVMDAFIDANWTYNSQYMSDFPVALGQALTPPPGLWPVVLLLGAAIPLVGTMLLGDDRVRRLGLVIVVWIGMAYLSASLGRRGFPHYFAPLLAPLVAAIVAGGASLFRGWTRQSGLALLCTLPLLLSVAATFTAGSGDQLAVRVYGQDAQSWIWQEEVGAWLRDQANEGDDLFVLGKEPGFYWTSGLPPATRWLYTSVAFYRPELQATFDAVVANGEADWLVVPGGSLEEVTGEPLSEVWHLEQTFGAVHVYERVH